MVVKHAIVTGAAGLLGRHVARAYRDAGYRVTALDVIGQSSDGIEAVDLRDFDAAARLIQSADCVAHTASIPRPIGYEAEDVFRTNMGLMFNVLAAMENADIPRLIFASSFSILGLPFAARPIALQFLPIDESHPAQPQDVYALTKWLGEEMTEAWVRKTGRQALSLRMPWIQTPQSFAADVVQRRATAQACLDLWAYIDARDAAKAFVLAAEAAVTGHERLFISAADTYSEVDTPTLVREWYPQLERPGGVEGNGSLLSNSRARDILGFEPDYSWRDYPLAINDQ